METDLWLLMDARPELDLGDISRIISKARCSEHAQQGQIQHSLANARVAERDGASGAGGLFEPELSGRKKRMYKR